jgi:hypothetical protein
MNQRQQEVGKVRAEAVKRWDKLWQTKLARDQEAAKSATSDNKKKAVRRGTEMDNGVDVERGGEGLEWSCVPVCACVDSCIHVCVCVCVCVRDRSVG